ncbi:VOC family protein [Rothia sp. AR01]|uniref:VOC family protein n=1 Tax=Rothia santali TaxID=2949643 RepID=A0A9X2HH67_9MICC|nr:VOC family protein [Rothia santali]MCP3424788.1 VOC family protein [Rothia santali]
MTSSIATYIALPGTTAEAMEHWHEVLGGELEVIRYGDMDLQGMPFAPDPQSVAHATLTLPGGVISGGDAMDDGNDYPLTGTAYSLLYTAEGPEEARTLFQKFLDAGGTVGMPLEQAPWGGWYGTVFDRFGVMWAFSADSAEED